MGWQEENHSWGEAGSVCQGEKVVLGKLGFRVVTGEPKTTLPPARTRLGAVQKEETTLAPNVSHLLQPVPLFQKRLH